MQLWRTSAQSSSRTYPSAWLLCLGFALTGIAVGLEGFVVRSPTLMILGMVIGSARAFLTLLIVRGWNEAEQTGRLSDDTVVSQSTIEHYGAHARNAL